MQDHVIDVHIQKLTLMGELFHVRRIDRHNSNLMSYLMNYIILWIHFHLMIHPLPYLNNMQIT